MVASCVRHGCHGSGVLGSVAAASPFRLQRLGVLEVSLQLLGVSLKRGIMHRQYFMDTTNNIAEKTLQQGYRRFS